MFVAWCYVVLCLHEALSKSTYCSNRVLRWKWCWHTRMNSNTELHSTTLLAAAAIACWTPLLLVDTALRANL
jgi:hypothetical protein